MDNSIWIALLGSSAMGAIVAGVVSVVTTAINKRIQKGDPSKVALRLLLQDKLTQLMEKEIAQGYTTVAQHKYIQQSYSTYKDLEGNGDMEWLKGKYDGLPVK